MAELREWSANTDRVVKGLAILWIVGSVAGLLLIVVVLVVLVGLMSL